MGIDAISLIVLVGAIALAFLFKVNSGLVAIAASLILARVAGIGDSALMKMFDSKMFLMLLGIMYIFCIAQENGTLELLSKKILALCKGKVKLFPLILFVLSAVLSAVGPGLISVTALMAPLVVALAKEAKAPTLKLLPFATLGAVAAGLSSLAPSGIVAIETAAQNGIMNLATPLMIQTLLTNFLYAAVLYFFVFKCHKLPDMDAEAVADSPAFTWRQWATLGGIVLTALLTALPGLEVNVGLSAVCMAVILTAVGAANEGAALKKMPWGTLILIGGMGLLISLVAKLGGIDLLSNLLQKLMGPVTAAPIITVLAGVMSWFSSASGVVMPTLIPTVPGIVANISGVSAMTLTIGVCIGANLAVYSPLSSCGGLMLAAYTSSGVDEDARNKMFGQLFAISAGAVLFGGLLALTGMYGWIG